MKNNTLQKHTENKQKLNDKLRAVLTYTGWMLTGIFSVVYIIILIIIIFGFHATLRPEDMWLITLLGAFFTFIISMSMMWQGILLAKTVDGVKVVNENYHIAVNKKKKEKKIRTIGFYVAKTAIINLITKAGTVAVLTYAVINFIIQGLNDMMILWLGLSNILLAIGLGMLALLSAYDFYLEQHIPALRIKTDKINQIKPSGVDTTTKETINAKN